MTEHSTTIWTRNFILLCVGNLLMSMAFYFLIPVLPIFIGKSASNDKSTIGIVLAIYTLAALIIRPFTGNAIDKYGRKTIFIYSFLGFSVLFVFYGFATSVPLMLILRLLHGFSWGILTTTFAALIVDILPTERRGEGLGLFGMGMTLAMSLGPILGVYIEEQRDFTTMFFAAAVLSLTGFVLILLIKYPHFEKVDSGKRSMHTMFEKTAFPISLNMVIIMLTYGGIISFISIYGKEIGIKNPGLFFVVYAIALGVVRIVAGKVFDRQGPKTISIIGLISIIIGFPILALVQNLVGFLTAAFVMGCGLGVVFPIFQAMVNNMVTPQRRGLANSTLFTSIDIGIGGGMVLMGFLADAITISHTFFASTFIALLGLVIFIQYTIKDYAKKIIK